MCTLYAYAFYVEIFVMNYIFPAPFSFLVVLLTRTWRPLLDLLQTRNTVIMIKGLRSCSKHQNHITSSTTSKHQQTHNIHNIFPVLNIASKMVYKQILCLHFFYGEWSESIKQDSGIALFLFFHCIIYAIEVVELFVIKVFIICCCATKKNLTILIFSMIRKQIFFSNFIVIINFIVA